MTKNASPANGEAMPKSPPSDALSFVCRIPHGGGFDYWAVQPTGDYTTDCAMGRKMGEEYLAFIGQHPTNGNATLLGAIVNSMIERAATLPRSRRGRGLEVGFLAVVNEYALASARLVRIASAA